MANVHSVLKMHGVLHVLRLADVLLKQYNCRYHRRHTHKGSPRLDSSTLAKSPGSTLGAPPPEKLPSCCVSAPQAVPRSSIGIAIVRQESPAVVGG